MNGNSWGASTKTSSAMLLSFLANDAVLPLKPEAFCRNPCKHKILSFLEGFKPVTWCLLNKMTFDLTLYYQCHI